jgi:sugar lactone lactonase YvrE
MGRCAVTGRLVRALTAAALLLVFGFAAQADATVRRGEVHPTSGCAAAQCVYVTNGRLPGGEYKVTGYNATGDVAPVADIVGQSTLLDEPWGIAVDSKQNLYVTNAAFTGDGYVAVYKAGATGDVAPAFTIGGGSNNPLCYPLGIAVTSQGSGDDTVYVANSGCGGRVVAFTVISGVVAELGAVGGSKTGMAAPWGIAVNAHGNIYVANYAANTITVYQHGTFGNVAPTRTIGGALTGLSGPAGLAVDAVGNLYVSNFDGNTITVYSPFANGNVMPSALVSGSSTGLNGPLGVALDRSANIYVANYYGPSALVFAAGSNGNVAPAQTISGSKTLMQYPEGIAVLVPSVALRAR